MATLQTRENVIRLETTNQLLQQELAQAKAELSQRNNEAVVSDLRGRIGGFGSQRRNRAKKVR